MKSSYSASLKWKSTKIEHKDQNIHDLWQWHATHIRVRGGTYIVVACSSLAEYMRAGSMYAWCACHSSFTDTHSNDDWRARVRLFCNVYSEIYSRISQRALDSDSLRIIWFGHGQSIPDSYLRMVSHHTSITVKFTLIFSFSALFFSLFTSHSACTLHRATQLRPLTCLNRLCEWNQNHDSVTWIQWEFIYLCMPG